MHPYIGTFLIGLATLALEITLARFLSVVTWYHLAFFAVSAAMLGMTAGAATVHVEPRWWVARGMGERLSRASLQMALTMPISLAILCFLPVSAALSPGGVLALLAATVACSLPFYFSGLVITTVLTRTDLPVGRIYAADLIGAALGCLLVLAGLRILDAPSLILVCALVATLAAVAFHRPSGGATGRRRILGVGATLVALLCVNLFVLGGVRPYFVKGRPEVSLSIDVDEWNSFSRVLVYNEVEAHPHYWGKSPQGPLPILPQRAMTIDGIAGTVMSRFSSQEDLEYLRYDVTNLVHYLRPDGVVCVIGVGGGRDIQSALAFDHESIEGIEINPTFVNLLRGRFSEFAGVGDHHAVRLVTDEARSYLSRSERQYAVVQMSLTDTWAATGAGAFSLSENALYTVEAWLIVIDRLTEDGIFTTSRWFNPDNLGETGRLLSLAMASLFEAGIENPAAHVAMVTVGKVCTLLLARRPFDFSEVAELERVSRELGYDVMVLPGQAPANEVLARIRAARSVAELDLAVADQKLNLTPPTDEKPYFFNMLRLGSLRLSSYHQTGIGSGNLVATLTLLALMGSLSLFCLVTIVLPMTVKTGRSSSRVLWRQIADIPWAQAFFFVLIGAGFMLAEIALVQRLTVFLGHPTYALGILLFIMILSSGVGSLLSERLPSSRGWLVFYPWLAAGSIVALRFGLGLLTQAMASSGMPSRILVSILLIFPLGVILGLFFPTGMRIVGDGGEGLKPWYWALNGIVGVLASAIAVFLSIYFGISTTMYVAALCYAALSTCVVIMTRGPVTNALRLRDRDLSLRPRL